MHVRLDETPIGTGRVADESAAKAVPPLSASSGERKTPGDEESNEGREKTKEEGLVGCDPIIITIIITIIIIVQESTQEQEKRRQVDDHVRETEGLQEAPRKHAGAGPVQRSPARGMGPPAAPEVQAAGANEDAGGHWLCLYRPAQPGALVRYVPKTRRLQENTQRAHQCSNGRQELPRARRVGQPATNAIPTLGDLEAPQGPPGTNRIQADGQ
mmetsp:Transcript_32326/g.76010  ORF Transcript_32326/g.76010 Transcript_32326/m.76010 type:complete len:214 (+) Transcript_32326:1640-2281(+)